MISIPAQDLISSGESNRLSVWKGRFSDGEATPTVDNGVRFGDRIRGDTIHISELL
jgi:hypothetical protein